MITLGLVVALAAAAAISLWWLADGGKEPARASIARLVLETEGRQLWQASVLWDREFGNGGNDLAALVAAGYADPAMSAKFRRGTGTIRFVSRAPMPAVAAGDPWGGPGERTSVAIPAAHLAVHDNGAMEWIPVDRFAAEIAPELEADR